LTKAYLAHTLRFYINLTLLDDQLFQMSYIDDFIQAEQQKMNWFDRVFRNYPQFRTTRFLAGNDRIKGSGNGVVIGPSLWGRLITGIIIAFATLIWAGLLFIQVFNKKLIPVVFSFWVFITLMIIGLAYQAYFNKRYVYKIFINTEGIRRGDDLVRWDEMVETGIMNKQKGRATNYFLVLFLENGSVVKHDLYLMGGYPEKYARIIEYYKEVAIK